MSTQNNFSDTTSDICVARQQRKLTTTWMQATEAEEGSKLLRTLRREGIGTKEMEVTVAKQVNAKKTGEKIFKRRGDLLGILFAEKLEDSYRWEVKRRWRRSIDRMKLEDLLGAKSRRCRNSVKNIKKKSDDYRKECKLKNKEKIEHLLEVYGNIREKDRAVELPVHLKQYSAVKVFTEGCNLACEELKGPVIVEREGHPLTLSKGERAALSLGPKFCVYEDCNEERFVTNIEISFLKYKWDKMSEIEKEPYNEKSKIKISSETQSRPVHDGEPVEKDENTAKRDLSTPQDEDKRIMEEMKRIQAMARSIFIEEEMTFDYSKKKATDMKQNTHVYLPGALGLEAEAGLEVLRQEWKSSYREFTKDRCNKKKEQESNLTKEEREGLISLKKRIKEGNIIVVPTDKSGRFSVMDLETYTQAGLKHASKDEVISLDQVRDNQHELNSQVSMILKIFKVGGTWGHGDRARGNMLCNSEMICNMYILFKDHKGWHWGLGTDPPGRPIASGNGGQNIHMSELTSEIIESVVTAYKGGVEIISTEDMLAKWNNLNKKNENWSPGGWWEGYEEDGLTTCGMCTGENDEAPDFCTCPEGTQPEGRKDEAQPEEIIPEDRMTGTSYDRDNTEDQNQMMSNEDDPGMSKVTLEVTGHLDESHAEVDITQGQGANHISFNNNNKKNYKKNKKNNKTNKIKISKSKFTVVSPDGCRQKNQRTMSQPTPVLSPEGLRVQDNETIPEGRKEEKAYDTEVGKPNRIEEHIRNGRSGDITGQKMRITVRYMKEKRRSKWERDFKWLERDLDRLIDSTEANPEDLQDFSLPMVLIGSDVASLYPSLDAERVADLVYKAVMESGIKWEQIDYLEATRYIALNWTEEQCSNSKLRRVLPRRRSNKGTRPGVRGTGPSGPTRGDQEQWRWRPNLKLKEAEKREILARVIQIAVNVMFRTHVYTFGGQTYRQTSGGPIGLRSTCAVARLVMKVWDDKWLARLSELRIQIEEALRYMDDGRTAMYRFKHGWRWCMGRVKYCKRWEVEDAGLSGLEVTKRILEGTMGGLEGYLTFTMETEEDFENAWLPTLDTELKVDDKKNIIMYRFFEKPTNPNTVLHFRTAMAEDSKIRSLTNEVIRRLLTTGEMIPDEARCQILDNFAQKMKNSGYGLLQIRRVILGGIKGYEKMVKKSKAGGRSLHRSSGESSAARTRKKLTGKSEWFRKADQTGKEADEEEDKSLDKWRKAGKKDGKETEDCKLETRSVLFVEQSKGGELAKRLREVERKANKIVGYKTKIVEGVGNKLKDLLPNANPWKGAHCGREKCIPCNQPTDQKQDCRRRNIIYENICLTCNPETESKQPRQDGHELADKGVYPSIYVGESGRSLHERAQEHWQDFKARETDSHILKHWLVHHQGQGTPSFHIRVVRYCKDALSRQVGEAVRISYRSQTLNSKNGYNRSGLSRLVIEEREEETLEITKPGEQPDPKGLPSMSEGWKAGEKRIAGNALGSQNCKKKRRKLKYETVDEEWGLCDGEDLRRMEKEEQARSSFLKAGQTDCAQGKLERQTTLRIWSEAELMCRELAVEVMSQSKIIGTFKTNLEADLKTKLMDIQQQVTHSQETNPPEDVQDVEVVNKEKEIIPEVKKSGRKKKISKKRTINSMFAEQELKAINKLEEEIVKEERLATKKRLELKWKERKAHSLRKVWAEEWLEERVLDTVVRVGSTNIAQRVEALVMDILDSSVKIGRDRQSTRLDIEKEMRLKEAMRKKEKLLVYLDRWWTTLEAGDAYPEMETQPTQRSGKRKKDPTRKEKIRDEERKAAEEMAGSMVGCIMDMVDTQHDCGLSSACPGWWCQRLVKKRRVEKEVEKITSLIESWKLGEPDQEPNVPVGRKPVVARRRGKLEEVRQARTTSGTSDHHFPQEEKETVTEGRKMIKEGRWIGRKGKLEEERRARTTSGTLNHHEPQVVKDNVPKDRNMEINCLETSEEKTFTNIKSSRSPVKDIITNYENFQQNLKKNNHGTSPNRRQEKKENHGTSLITSNKLVAGRVKKLAGNFDPKKEEVIPEVGKSKPAPNKRVWTKLKSGLFGWKLSKPKSESSKTSYDISKTPKIFTHIKSKNLEAISVSETSRRIPPKILFGGEGGSGALRDITKTKINKGGLEVLAKTASSVRLPGGQKNETMKNGGEI